MQMGVSWVIAAIQYEKFVVEYERKYVDLNKRKE